MRLGNTMAMMLCSTGQVRPGSCARNSFQGRECLRLLGLHSGKKGSAGARDRNKAGAREVRDEHPGRGVANASEEGHSEHETPSLAQRTSQRVGAQEPNAGPQAEDEGVVLDAAKHPLAPEPERRRTSR